MNILLRVPMVGSDTLAAALSALQTMDELWLRQHPGAPLLYHSGIRYRPELATEEWIPWPALLEQGYGDCEDLAAARASELRVLGVDPQARAIAYRSGPQMWHAVVRRGDGSLEDPSLRLGMRRHRGILSPGPTYHEV